MNREITEPFLVSQDDYPGTREGAVAFLREYFGHCEGEDGENLRTTIRDKIKSDPEWWSGVHFGWGMAVRNLLRQHGFGEQELGVANLDDVYVGIVEAAVA